MRRRMSMNCCHARFGTARASAVGGGATTAGDLGAGTTRPGDVAGGSRPGVFTEAGAEGPPRRQDPAVDASKLSSPAVVAPPPTSPGLVVPASTAPADIRVDSISARYQLSVWVLSLSITVSGKPIAAPTWRIAMRGRKVTTLATIPVRSGPYLS